MIFDLATKGGPRDAQGTPVALTGHPATFVDIVLGFDNPGCARESNRHWALLPSTGCLLGVHTNRGPPYGPPWLLPVTPHTRACIASAAQEVPG